MGLPTDYEARKALPIFRGPLMYFPDALLALAAVCKAGNNQHNPGEPLHWAREKSTEQMDTALRHMMDHGLGNTRDVDGTYHLAKAAWRLLAELQLTIERDQNEAARKDLVARFPDKPDGGPDIARSEDGGGMRRDVTDVETEQAWFQRRAEDTGAMLRAESEWPGSVPGVLL